MRMGAWSAVAAVYLAAVVLLTWPLAADPVGHLVSIGWAATSNQIGEDQLHIMWTLTWGAHALTSEPARFFDGNVFHPQLGILSQSEHMLGNQLVFAPVWLATNNPVLAMNAVITASLLLSAFAMHVLVRSWTGSTPAACVAALAFACAPWRLSMLSLPQLLPVMYLPVIVLALDRTATSPSGRTAILAGVALALQTLTSYYLGYVAFALAGIYVLADLLGRGIRRGWRTWAAFVIALVIVPLVLVLPITLPYLQAQLRGELSWLWPAKAVEGLRTIGMGAVVARRTWSFVGGGALLLAVLGALRLGRAWRVDRPTGIRLLALLLMALAGIVLAAGPAGLAGGWIGLFAPLARVVPGFANVRDPGRFLILTSFAASVLAGFAVAGVQRWTPGRPRAARIAVPVLAGGIVLAPLAAVPRPLVQPLASGSRVPEVYQWLARHGEGGPLVEVPIGSAALGLQRTRASAKAMYFSTVHWLPTLNGHTSYPPASYQLFEGYAAQLPGPEALDRLARESGLRWILVHAKPEWRAEGWRALGGVEKRGTFPHDETHQDHLYEVVAPRGDASKRRFSRARTLDGHRVEPVGVPRGRVRIDGLADRVAGRVGPRVTITVDNAGNELWPASTIDAAERIALLLAWTNQDRGRVVSRQWIVLPADVPAGRSVSFTAWLRAQRPGRYRVTAHLVRGETPPEEVAPWAREVRVVRSPIVPAFEERRQ